MSEGNIQEMRSRIAELEERDAPQLQGEQGGEKANPQQTNPSGVCV